MTTSARNAAIRAPGLAGAVEQEQEHQPREEVGDPERRDRAERVRVVDLRELQPRRIPSLGPRCRLSTAGTESPTSASQAAPGRMRPIANNGNGTKMTAPRPYATRKSRRFGLACLRRSREPPM